MTHSSTAADSATEHGRFMLAKRNDMARRYPYASVIDDAKKQLPEWAFEPAFIAGASAVLAVAGTLGAARGYRRWFKRIPNADSVTGSIIEKQPFIKGVVTRVGDGDGFRLYHTPGPFWRWPLKFRRVPTGVKDLKNQTLSIRIAGVDAPEMAHFGNPAQPHAKESFDWLVKEVTGKVVRCQLLRKDQYNRIVGLPYIHRTILPDKPLPLMMLKEGMAVVYTQGGSEYGPWGLEKMQRLEDEAKRAKRGMWASRNVQLPSDYKKRVKEGETPIVETKSSKKSAEPGFFEKLGRWLGSKT